MEIVSLSEDRSQQDASLERGSIFGEILGINPPWNG